ncbi:MAG: YHS domain-containing protein [Ignavibacteria bacterium]|nr:YHS domain-containing protein [Ignavibacteria bacterium]
MKAFAFALLTGLIVVFSANSFVKSSVTSNSADSTVSEKESTLSDKESALVCPVSKETITGEGVKYEYLGQQFVLCCEGCAKSFNKNPAKYMSGGLKDVVCGMDDGNKEINAVSNGVKYYFCNETCKEKFEKDPDQYLNEFKKK